MGRWRPLPALRARPQDGGSGAAARRRAAAARAGRGRRGEHDEAPRIGAGRLCLWSGTGGPLYAVAPKRVNVNGMCEREYTALAN